MLSHGSKPPIALRIVAWLFVVNAGFTLARLAYSLVDPPIMLDPAVLGFWIGPGLLRGNRTWRRWALGVLAIQVVALGLATLRGAGLSVPGTVRMRWFSLEQLPPWGWAAVMLSMMLLAAWQIRVLLRPDVRALFAGASEPARHASEIPA